MALPLLQTELSAFWGLIRVSANFSSPAQQVHERVDPTKNKTAGSSIEELISAEDRGEQDVPETSEPPSPWEPGGTAVPAQLDDASDRSFRLSNQTTQVVESKDATYDASSSTFEPVVEKQEQAESSATPTPSVSLRKGKSRHFSRILPDKVLEKRGSLRSNHGSARSKNGESVDVNRSSQEEAAFTAFRRLCATQGLLKRPQALGKHDVPEGINDDATLRRFFDARKHDVGAAHAQFKEACLARDVNQLCTFYEEIGVDEFDETRKLYPEWVGTRDKNGLPLCLFDFSIVQSKTLAAHKKSSDSMQIKRTNSKTPGVVSTDVLRAMAVYEHMTRFVMPLCSAIPERQNPDEAVTKMICIVDISNISLRQVWSVRGYIQDIGKLFAVNYPEVLGKVFVIGAPSYFPTIWSWLKKWVDEGTVAKLNIVPASETLSQLQSCVDMANIPTRFGGEFEYVPGMPIRADAAIRERLKWSKGHNDVPKGPLKWVDENKGTSAIEAVGKTEGQARKERVAVLRTRPRRSHKPS